MSLHMAPRTQPILHLVSHVPAHLRRAYPYAFDPQILSLGPIHSNDDWNDSFAFKSNSIFASLSKPDSTFEPDELWSSITKHLSAAKSISTIVGTIEVQKKDAVEMNTEILQQMQKIFKATTVVGDIVFLVSCFLTDLHTDPKSLQSKYGVSAINDVVKLDNQLPIELIRAVVAELPSTLETTGSEKSKNTEPETFRVGFSEDDFPQVVLSFCRFYSPFPQPNSPSLDWGKKKTLLDCLHTTISGDFESIEAETSTAWTEIAERECLTAREMVRVGIQFETEGAQDIAGIHFENGVLRLPVLVLNEQTETVLRNLMVLEASYKEKPVSDYVRFLSGMVECGDDVAVLKKVGVLKGYFRKDEKVVEFIKSLDDFHYIPARYVLPIQKALAHLRIHYEENVKMKEGEEDRLGKYIEKEEWNVDRLVEHIEKKEGHVDRLVENIEKNEGNVNRLAENIEKKERDVIRLAENIEKKERDAIRLAENVEEKERHVDRLVENIEKNEGHVNRLAENIEKKEGDVNRLAEDLEKKEGHVNLLVENIEKKEGYVDHLVEKIEEKEGHVNRFAENIEEKERHVNRLAVNIEEKEGHVDRLVENIDKKEEQMGCLAENIEKKEGHVNRVAENIEQKEEHVNRLAENIEKKEGDVDRLIENIEKNEAHVNHLVKNIEKNERHVNHSRENIEMKERHVNQLAENIEIKEGHVNRSAENIGKKERHMNLLSISAIALIAAGLLMRLRFVLRK